MVRSRLQTHGPTISFAGLILGFLIITVGGRVGAPLLVAGIGIALIAAALIVPFTRLPTRRRREEQKAATDSEEGKSDTTARPEERRRADLGTR
jgi:hypothetical protein